MGNENSLRSNSPDLFQPSVVRGTVDGGTPTGQLNFVEASVRNLGTTSSFRYDPPGAGLRSTQQLNVDWTNFENHTFFQSAVVNVNIAFDRIVNGFPYDGTRKETEEFLDNLTGFEKWVYDQFSKNNGYLFLSGSGDSSGTFIEIKDFAGSEFPTISRNVTGDSILDPGLGSISFEMQLYVPDEANVGSVVLQKVSGSNNGMTLYLSESSSTTSGLIAFTAISGSNILETTASFTKGQFNHVVATFNRKPGINRVELYVNEVLAHESTSSTEFGLIDFTVSPFLIGSGVAVVSHVDDAVATFTPASTLSGALDELRVFHDLRTIEQQKAYAKKGIFNTEELKLYLKFNEPSGTISPTDADNRLIIDYSGNSLHGRINEEGFNFSLRNTSSIANPMTFEKSELSPVLFTSYQPITDLNGILIESASRYDEENPNLITKLVPPHYFLEGQQEEAFETEDGTIIDAYSGEAIPGSGDLGQAQLLSQLLYIWAKFWDEMKMFADAFSTMFHVSYDKTDNVPDQFLTLLARAQGFELPNLFTDADIEQFVDAENLDHNTNTGTKSLQSVQNEIWRRILINMRDIIDSKGTLHSVKSLIRATGIDPDTTFRIREYGGPTKKTITNEHELRTEVSTMLDMSGATAFITSSALTGSRTEVGFPEAQGSFVQKDLFAPHGISTNADDGLMTSGSFTYEGIYRWPLTRQLSSSNQSLMRLVSTGSDATFAGSRNGIVANLVALSGSDQVRLYVRPGSGTNAPFLELALTGVNVFDGNKWNVSFGRNRHDDPSSYLDEFSYAGLVKSDVSSSYFLRAARSERGKVREKYVTQSFFHETENHLQSGSTTFNDRGMYLSVGEEAVNEGTLAFLNNSTIVTSSLARNIAFDGLIGHMRFWSKGLLFDEWMQHVFNFKSLGVEDPLTNFNFVTVESGSFSKLRIDANTDQLVTASNATGGIQIFDFSQNGLVFSGSGFEADTNVIKPETFYFSHISPRYDEAASSNKVRPRGFINSALAAEMNVDAAPVYEIRRSEMPQDDVRFTIDFSIVDALDQDIVNIFSTLEEIDSAIGAPELLFSEDYPGLENLRDVYFNRLTDKINLKSFFEFFKWFDRSIGLFIESLIPHKTKFRGVNFVVESHMLERAKFKYLFLEQYLGNGQRHAQQGTILLQQFLAQVKKF
jgi:hypothetical protein